MNHDPQEWSEMDEYVKAQSLLRELKVVNDTAERAVKLMSDFNNKLTCNEDQYQYIMLCVKEHREMYPDVRKSTLKS